MTRSKVGGKSEHARVIYCSEEWNVVTVRLATKSTRWY